MCAMRSTRRTFILAVVAVFFLSFVEGRRRPGSRTVLSRALRERQQACAKILGSRNTGTTKSVTGVDNNAANVPSCAFNEELLEDCMVQCISPLCRDKIYASDPLEEGEFDNTRMAAFNRCVLDELRLERRK